MTGSAKLSNSFYEFAFQCGVPADTLARFETAHYYPQPKQMLLHAACRQADNAGTADRIGYGGALGGGKTHGAFAQIAIDDCQRFPNLKVLFLRKVGKYARESIDDLRRTVLRYVRQDFKNSLITYPNDSRIILGSYQYEKDIDNYLSLEYDIILIEQAEQLSASKLELIHTRNRSSKGFRPRMMYTFNPGGVSHNYLKELFIKPYRAENETDTKFIFANAEDNIYLNDDYKRTLDRLTGWQKEAWVYGNWDVSAGQYFDSFNYEQHVIPPEAVPDLTRQAEGVWCALDYGFKHYTVCYLFAKYDGITYVVDEFAARKQLISANCQGMHEMLERYGLTVDDLTTFVAGTDVFARRGDTGESFADEFAKYGISLHAANVSRRAGAGKILQILGDAKQAGSETVKISTRCSRLIECLPSLLHNPNDPEDVLKVDTDDQGRGGDDYYDAFRYGVMVNTAIGISF